MRIYNVRPTGTPSPLSGVILHCENGEFSAQSFSGEELTRDAYELLVLEDIDGITEGLLEDRPIQDRMKDKECPFTVKLIDVTIVTKNWGGECEPEAWIEWESTQIVEYKIERQGNEPATRS